MSFLQRNSFLVKRSDLGLNMCKLEQDGGGDSGKECKSKLYTLEFHVVPLIISIIIYLGCVYIYNVYEKSIFLQQPFIHHTITMRFTITTALGFLFAAGLAHAQTQEAPAGTSPLDALNNYCKTLGPAGKDPVALTTAFCGQLAAGSAATGQGATGGGSIPGVKELCQLVKTEPIQAGQAVGSLEKTAPLPGLANSILDKAQNICKEQGKGTPGKNAGHGGKTTPAQ